MPLNPGERFAAPSRPAVAAAALRQRVNRYSFLICMTAFAGAGAIAVQDVPTGPRFVAVVIAFIAGAVVGVR